MKAMQILLCLMILTTLITCLVAELFVLNSVSQTISRIDLATESVNNTFALTGLFPNKMAIKDGYIYLTNSGDSNIQVIDIENGSTTVTIQLENYSNPYDLLIHQEYAYVTGMLTDKVYKIDLATNSVVAELTVGVAPLGLIVYNDLLYVANSGYQYPSYLPGELTVIDLEDFSTLTTIPVPLSPYRMIVDNDGFLHLVCSGNYLDVMGEVVVINTDDQEIVEQIPLNTYATNIILSPWNRVYIADAFGAGLLAYDLPDFEIVYDSDDLFSTGGSALAIYEDRLFVADAGDFMSNSIVRIYDAEENFLNSYQTAMGAVDIAFRPSTTNIAEDVIISPQMFKVYPNPFQAKAEIKVFSDPYGNDEEFEITIYNLRGQRIRKLVTSSFSISWDGKDGSGKLCAPGVYLLKFSNKNGVDQTGKITLIK
ncbi:MAG: T9SS type A sorting domain-containing protein [Candidatus Cloacimonetes bacterium]|nr:T9SS type A sorting domain-containing protein [Candidatus Cloacimonadota bacterium]